MEKVLDFFLEELRNANEDIIKLSVVTALHSFIIKESKFEIVIDKAASDLIEILCEILKDGLELDDSDLLCLDAGNENMENSAELDSKTNCRQPSRTGKACCQSDGKTRVDKLCSQQKSEDRNETTVENLNRFMALKCIYELSKKYRFFRDISLMVRKLTLFTLSAFLSCEKSEWSDQLYRFSHNFTQCYDKFIRSIKGQVTVQIKSGKNMSESSSYLLLKQQLKMYQPEYAEHFEHIFNEKDRLLSLRIIPDSPADIDIVDVLKSQQVAWGRGVESDNDTTPERESKLYKKKANENKTQEDPTVSCEAMVTKVLNGNLFWVNIGKEGVQNAAKIHTILQASVPSLQRCKKCMEKDIVAVVVNEQPSKRIIRGKVLCVKSKIVTVFGLDIGGVFDVLMSSVYSLPPQLDVSVVPQQAVIANLYDVSPAPVDSSYVEIAAASLSNITRSHGLAKMLRKLEILKTLPRLLRCGDTRVVHQAMRLATNVSRIGTYTHKEDWWSIMLAALELLNAQVKKVVAASDAESVCNASSSSAAISPPSPSKAVNGDQERLLLAGGDRNLIISALTLLSNIIHSNKSMKEVFHKQHGLKTVLICQRMLVRDGKVQRTVIRLLSCFVHNRYSLSQQSLPALCRNNKHSVMAEVFNEESHDHYSDDSDGDSGSCHDDDGEVDNEWGELDDKVSCAGIGGAYKQESMFHTRTDEKRTKFLVKGSKFPMASNPRYEMLQGVELSFSSITSIVCGMLNSGHGGTIYVGITNDGVVTGEKLSLDQRDNLRLGIDEVTGQLVPPTVHFQVQVRFLPVVEWEDEEDAVKDTEYFVLEILCCSMPGIIHTDKKGNCYYRTGRKTLNINEQGIRHLIVLDEEEKYREEILALQAQIEKLTTSSDDSP